MYQYIFTGPAGEKGEQGIRYYFLSYKMIFLHFHNCKINLYYRGETGEKGEKGNDGERGEPGLIGPRGYLVSLS